MRFIKKNYKYIILFIFFLSFLLLNYNFYQGDTVANYGFSYAIERGEIPYKDFNMVITPFSPFLYSIGLFIYNNLLMIYIEQSILICILIYLLDKLIGKNYILFILGVCIFYPVSLCTTIFPGYNFICFLLLIFLFYLLKNSSNDILIGIVLGLIFCTKQSVGLLLLIPSIYYLFRDREIFIKRVVGFIIPIGILLIYLIITDSLHQFIDLCFLGLFSFNKGNSSISIFYLCLLILGIIYLIYRIIKNNSDYELYYLLLFSIISLPIVDYYHVSLFLIGVLYLICRDINIKTNIYKYIIIFIVVLFMSSLETEYYYSNKKIKLYNYNHFSLYLKYPNYNKKVKSINKFLNKKDNIYYLLRGTEAYFFRIVNDQDISYYDLLNRGNYGYNGESRIISRINNIDSGSIIVVDDSLCRGVSNNQFLCDSLRVLDKCKLVKRYDNFIVYIKE